MFKPERPVQRNIEHASDDLREVNLMVRQAFESTAGLSSEELTICRRTVVHGIPAPVEISEAQNKLIGNLQVCFELAQKRGLGDVVGWCMAAAQPVGIIADGDDIDPVVLDYIRSVVPPPAKVLDVASGTGRFSLPLAEDGYTVTLLDPAAAFLEAALQRVGKDVAKNVESMICGTFGDLSRVASDSFEVCLCLGSIFYAHSKELAEQTLVHLGRIARRAVIVDVMSREGLISRLDIEGFDTSAETVKQILDTGVTPVASLENGRVVYTCFSLPELRQAISRSGLVIDRLLGFGGEDGMRDTDDQEYRSELYPRLLALCRTHDVLKYDNG